MREDPARGIEVSLSMKNVDQEAEDKDPENKKMDLTLITTRITTTMDIEITTTTRRRHRSRLIYSACTKAKVSSIKPYGVFVNLENTRASALIHVSRLANTYGFWRRYGRGQYGNWSLSGGWPSPCFVK